LIGLISLSLSFPTDLHEDFSGQNYVSKFARTGVEAIGEFVDHGFLESDATAAGRLDTAPVVCRYASFRTSSCCMTNPVSTSPWRPE
jgi:hypothetical protein